MLRLCAEQGNTDRRIAELLGISPSTLARWKREHKKVKDALEDGRKSTDRKVENALLKRALGYTYMEVTYERTVDEAGDEKMIIKRQVEKQVMPDLSAQAFWLKNRNPGKWKDKQETKWEGKDITVRLTDEENEN